MFLMFLTCTEGRGMSDSTAEMVMFGWTSTTGSGSNTTFVSWPEVVSSQGLVTKIKLDLKQLNQPNLTNLVAYQIN